MSLERELDALRRRASKIVKHVDPPKLSMIITKDGDEKPEVGPYDLWVHVESKKSICSG